MTVEPNELNREEKAEKFHIDIKRAHRSAYRRLVKYYKEQQDKVGGPLDWSPEDFLEIDFRVISGFAPGQGKDKLKDGVTGARVIRNPSTSEVDHVQIFASGFIYTGNNVREYGKKLVHEFYHTTQKGTHEFMRYKEHIRAGGEPILYRRREYEAKAFKFADDVY